MPKWVPGSKLECPENLSWLRESSYLCNAKRAEFSSKLQPTPEKIRMAALIQSSKSSQADRETAENIEEVRFKRIFDRSQDFHDLLKSIYTTQLKILTECDGEKPALVLSDCAYDLSKAVEVLLEGGGAPAELVGNERNSKVNRTKMSFPWVMIKHGMQVMAAGVETVVVRRGDTAPGGKESFCGRFRGGGRGQGGRGRGAGETRSGVPRDGDGPKEGRGRRAVNGSGGGRGRGGARGAGRSHRSQGDVEGFPESIDTWTNSQAEGLRETSE
ncbi:unnamed protein product [Notodromas monacha]|uniref:Uncharacterized protein n=1 Tax=Notodromas monacha TaxID=399045 RepID=A0A7R9BFP6_9CRUS|nr:unnamed protein product [Notodromas monacha]CAG0914579.1 unnamed protein product [Notodromas monacha]